MKTIMLVDDSATILMSIANILLKAGYAVEKVHVVKCGEEALPRARQARPDLILLDVVMPGLDGFEVCRRLKADAATRDIPVIFMTTLGGTQNKVAGFEAGGVDYVTKPFEAAEVLARVNTHLVLRAMQAKLEAQHLEVSRAYEELKGTNQRLEAAQSQLLQAEKMASIGVLAAGVAHEINNPIGFVSSNLGSLESYATRLLELVDAYAELDEVLAQAVPQRLDTLRRAKERADLDFLREDLRTLIDESKDGLLRVKKIVGDLKDFSHIGDTSWQLADLHQGLDSTLNLVWNAINQKAEVVKDYAQIPEIECVPLELNQVFMNLLTNAAQAIAVRGEIRIRSGAGEDGVWVEIADNGCGIAPEHLARIFDPFFTTKPVGQGTGLGLSLSYAAVQKHHGRIEVRSTPGTGTTFRVWLPLRQPRGE